jgi:tRNA(Arg) A34 adenosine deaminase TadA
MTTHHADELKFMQMALDLATENVVSGKGGPFGSVIVRDGVVISSAANRVTADNDPTAHAEVLAIRAACTALGSFQLPGCTLYTSCEPCPMCLGAIYWARIEKVYFANTQREAADAGFDDSFIYREIDLPIEQRSIPMLRLAPENSIACFDRWRASNSRVDY